MRRLFLPIFSFVLICLLTEPTIGLRSPGSNCKWTPVDVNDAWFFNFAEDGMENPMGTRYELKQGIGTPPPPGGDFNLKHRMCMTADFKILLRSFSLTVVFNYNRINHFKAVVVTEGTSAQDLFKLYGDFSMVKTDNRTYVLFFGCIFNSQPFWQVHTPRKTILSVDNRKDILRYVAINDFSIDPRDISSPSDQIYLEGASISDCSRTKEGITSGIPQTPADTSSLASKPGSYASQPSPPVQGKRKKKGKKREGLEALIGVITDLLGKGALAPLTSLGG